MNNDVIGLCDSYEALADIERLLFGGEPLSFAYRRALAIQHHELTHACEVYLAKLEVAILTGVPA